MRESKSQKAAGSRDTTAAKADRGAEPPIDGGHLGEVADDAPTPFGLLVKEVLKSLGHTTLPAGASFLGLKSPQILDHILKGRTKTPRADTLASISSAITSALRQHPSAPLDPASAASRSIMFEAGTEPLDALEKLIRALDGPFVPQRFLYDTEEAAKIWHRIDDEPWRVALVANITTCAKAWMKGSGPLAGLQERGFDLISLGTGTGKKERQLLVEVRASKGGGPNDLLLVDTSVPLLATARAKIQAANPTLPVAALCADFEHWSERTLAGGWPHASAQSAPGERHRLVTMFGNTFGNVTNEVLFAQNQLPRILRKGDFLWIEVARVATEGPDPTEAQPSSQPINPPLPNDRDRLMALPFLRGRRIQGARSAIAANLEIVREGPLSVEGSSIWTYRITSTLDSAARHTAVLYARRYETQPLERWFGKLGFRALARQEFLCPGSPRVAAVTHLLLEYDPRP